MMYIEIHRGGWCHLQDAFDAHESVDQLGSMPAQQMPVVLRAVADDKSFVPEAHTQFMRHLPFK
jgi:hypothetical protein